MRPETPAVVSNRDDAAGDFNKREVADDLEKSARAKFGDAATEQALSAPAFLLVKLYRGLPPPPIAQPDGSYRFPEPPTAMLVQRNGRWYAARIGKGFVPVAPDKAEALNSVLRDPGFWSDPDHLPQTCTDAGASLLWLKLPNRPVLVRRGACGSIERTERLVFSALDA